VGRGAGCPLSFSAPEKMREQSADRRWCGSAAPLTCLAARSISENAQRSPAGSPAGAPLDALLRCLPYGVGPRFQQCAYALPSASSWQEDIASGRSPDAARVPADEAKHPGAAPAKARISPGARRRDRWPVLRPRRPACSIKPASPVDAPRRARREQHAYNPILGQGFFTRCRAVSASAAASAPRLLPLAPFALRNAPSSCPALCRASTSFLLDHRDASRGWPGQARP
jgi:hypothetical protein